jgi:hypothetical protein
LVGLGDRPPGEPNEGAPPTSSVWVDTYEDGHPNDRVVFVDLDVVETLYGSLKNSIRSV